MNSLLLSLALLAPTQPPKANTPDPGVLPLGADGKPLNLDFETGDLKDWTAEGEAFKGQPIKGDTVAARRGDMRSRQQGQYWIGGYEKLGDKPTGTLTSVPFKVTHPWASFLVGGGPHALETCVEIVQGKDVIFRAAGLEEEDMRRVAVDLTKYKDKEIVVRIVDKHTGHWGHVNFDDFRFHTQKPNVPERPKAEPPAQADTYKYAGLKPDEAAKAMTVPEGFSVSVFAGEPDVHQPIAFCFDHRGRLWVAEAYVYPKRHPHPGPVLPENEKAKGDKIVIFEDTDGDGKFDKRTVFMEGLNLVSGIEVGFGGVWIGAAPYFLFVPHDEKTDKPAGEPKILLDGWGYHDTHETLNSFIWGPDGWLYGCHGVFTHSRVGKPGTPDKDRAPINAGIWRYHPTKHVFEVFARGTSNPWGLDYNANGDFFIEACVIPHMWHIIQGARYNRQAGVDFNPYTYDDIKTIAVHRHYVGGNPHGGNGRSDSAGGGHAHAGLMCYQGGAWPKEYNGKLFMGNLHGHRINVDVVTPKGSGYVADRNPDFLLTHDKWSIPLAIKSGPDGNVYLLDWYDKQICHTTNDIWDRTNGRIYKISYKDAKPVKSFDLSKATWAELVKYQEHENDWYARTARRIMQERAGRDPKANADARTELVKVLSGHPDPAVRLRTLWSLQAIGGLNEKVIATALESKSEQLIGWAVRAMADTGASFQTYQPVAGQVLRRQFASVLLQREPESRWASLPHLFAFPEDATDHNLPYLYWYALEPLCAADPAKALKIAADGKIPFVFQCAARRVGAIGTPEAFDLLTKSLAEAKTEEQRIVYFRGLQEGARGKRNLPTPKDWTAAFELLKKSPDAGVRNQALGLAVTFGDKSALALLRTVLADAKADTAARLAALTALVDAKDTETAPLLQAALTDKEVRGAALRALAAFDDAKTPAAVLAQYGSLTLAEKRDALATLSARVGYAKELMAAVAAKTVPSTDVPAEIVRQLRGYQDAQLDKQIADLWGVVRESPAEKKKLIAMWKAKLTAPMAPPGDVNLGRAVFAKTCQQCHTLYAVGGRVGPEITGANRGSVDYLLENILDPSAVIPKEYAATRIVTTDDRNVTGIVKGEANGVLTLQTERELLTIPVADIASRKVSELSMMPDDILKQTGEFEFRSLLAYLQTQGQVPMLANAENAKEFFNGKDINNWTGDKELWKVEGGEIVGRSATGLKRNTFLVSQLAAENFKLSLKVKLAPNRENSGIQFRSVPLPDGEMRGPQADIGAGWWGKLYEESGRGLLAKEGGEKFVKPDEWNDYVVEASGGHVRIWINGHLCTDYEDDKLARRGVFGLQLHSGGPLEVRFKDIKLEVLK
ncbi:PVC-type heme-binding CxxCH protein [Frigoriglobus tundricola]|uniref:Glycoside hydrolase n=1 Tax=Frigoriglobus tundricola TaxID=2774151 RepID=A0A6M5YXQ9_9BACT|nr:PVC-type heme-binding CxxCH protein [Frigoriglobus tundricola]QJW97742.1 glycoside hydrolase [Frigoriglobus tundricola]